MAKPGPKPKVTAAVKAEIVAALEAGLSLADTLLMLHIPRRTFFDAQAADDEFRTRIKGAATRGKLFHLQRIRDAPERWQASAWFLERKYGLEYGAKLKLDHGGSLQVVEQIVSAPHEAQASHEGNGHASSGAGRLPAE